MKTRDSNPREPKQQQLSHKIFVANPPTFSSAHPHRLHTVHHQYSTTTTNHPQYPPAHSTYQKSATHITSAACLPKKQLNLATVPEEYQRHRSKKSVNENFNLNNASEKSVPHRDTDLKPSSQVTVARQRQTKQNELVHTKKPSVVLKGVASSRKCMGQNMMCSNIHSASTIDYGASGQHYQMHRKKEEKLHVPAAMVSQEMTKKEKTVRDKSVSINMGNNFDTIRTELSGGGGITSTDRMLGDSDLLCEENLSVTNNTTNTVVVGNNNGRKESVTSQRNFGAKKHSVAIHLQSVLDISTATVTTLVNTPVDKKQPTPEQEIAEFEAKQEKIRQEFMNESLWAIIARQQEYTSIPHFSSYLDKKHKHINWIKRAVLVNWMMEAVEEYCGKRETLYISVNIVDRFLSLTPNYPLNKLQFVGLTALFIAFKLEEHARPPASTFAEDRGCTVEDIIQFEIELLKTLKWEINAPTLEIWCGRLTIQWDLYLEQEKNNEILPTQLISKLYFKQPSQEAYYNFRELVQLLDFALLEVHTLQYKNRAVVASFMYLIIGIRLGQFNKQQVVSSFAQSSKYLFDSQITFNEFYNNFLEFSYGISLADLLPTIQYCSTFFILPMSFDIPASVRSPDHKIGYEEFCQMQVRNKSNMAYLQMRDRNFD